MQINDLRFAFVDGQPNLIEGHAPKGCEDFSFRLHSKPVVLGEVEFQQFWMPHSTIYEQRNRGAINFFPLGRFWRRLCLEKGTLGDRGVCESYLLMALFPSARSNGSRRVLIDSIPSKLSYEERSEVLGNLDKMLDASQNEENSLVEFSNSTADYIGPPSFSIDCTDLYMEYSDELFDESVELLQNGDEAGAIESVYATWLNWQRKYGRRRKCDLQKRVMDILSYEARAAVHRCYSQLWETISFWLISEGHSEESVTFHRFWHFDLFWPASDEFPDQDFHLFHGHIFGLHPACRNFIQTSTGQDLIGQWLGEAGAGWQESGNPETTSLKRLLFGLNLAVYDYSTRHNVQSYLNNSDLSV